MKYLIGSLNQKIVFFEKKNVYGKNILVCCNDLAKLLNKIPLTNNKIEVSISKEEMENEILLYTLRNKNKIDINEIIDNNKTKYLKITSLYELYLLVMLKG